MILTDSKVMLFIFHICHLVHNCFIWNNEIIILDKLKRCLRCTYSFLVLAHRKFSLRVLYSRIVTLAVTAVVISLQNVPINHRIFEDNSVGKPQTAQQICGIPQSRTFPIIYPYRMYVIYCGCGITNEQLFISRKGASR